MKENRRCTELKKNVLGKKEERKMHPFSEKKI
jgi:hypothetical protein